MVRVAGIRAFAAGIGTSLAMVMVVHATLVATHPADFFAQQQVLVGQLRLALQQPGSLAANIGTISVQADASNHWFNINFLQAGCSTVFASCNASQQLFN